MRTLREYGLMGNMEDAHYLKYTLDAARRAGLVRSNHPAPTGQCTASSFTTKKPSCEANLAERNSNVAVLSPTAVGSAATPPQTKLRTKKPTIDSVETPTETRQGCGQRDCAHGNVAGGVDQHGAPARKQEGGLTTRGSTISRQPAEVDDCDEVCTSKNLAKNGLLYTVSMIYHATVYACTNIQL